MFLVHWFPFDYLLSATPPYTEIQTKQNLESDPGSGTKMVPMPWKSICLESRHVSAALLRTGCDRQKGGKEGKSGCPNVGKEEVRQPRS